MTVSTIQYFLLEVSSFSYFFYSFEQSLLILSTFRFVIHEIFDGHNNDRFRNRLTIDRTYLVHDA